MDQEDTNVCCTPPAAFEEVVEEVQGASSQLSSVSKKRRKNSLSCTHDDLDGHFSKNVVENAIKKKQVEIIMMDETSNESSVWLLCGFPEISGKLCTNWVICKECKALFSMCGTNSTSGPKRHIEKKHEVALKLLLNTKLGSQKQITDFGNFIPKQLSDSRKKEINEALYSFIIQNLLPASILNEPTFHNMIYVCMNIHKQQQKEKIFKIEDRRTFSRSSLPKLYESVKEEIINLLTLGVIPSLGGFVGGLTVDEWRDPYRKVAYLAVTCHFLDDNFSLYSLNLGTRQILETDNVNIANKIKEICNEFSINPSNCLFVTDSGSNIKSACFAQKWLRLPCMGHDINLLVQSDFLNNKESDDCKNLQTYLSNCREVVALFKRGKGQSQLEELRKSRGLQPFSLKLDVVTRWNSALLMVTSVIENYYLILDILGHDKRHDLITKLNRDNLRSLLEFLKPFESLTTKMSADQFITMPQFWPSVVILQTYLKYKYGWQFGKDIEDEPTYLSEFDSVKAILLQHMQTQVGQKHRRLEITMFHKLATCMDPRYKSLKMCESETEKKQIYDKLKQECTVVLSFNQTVPSLPVQQSNLELPVDEFMDLGEEINTGASSPEQKAQEELQQYFAYKMNSLTVSSPTDVNFLKSFWNNEGRAFPTIRLLARKYLAPPVTSTPCERLFSKSSHLINERRSMLAPRTVDAILFLNQNLNVVSK